MLSKLFGMEPPLSEPPIPKHIEEQRKYGAPFYCGTAYCGHSTIDAAAHCWNNKCEALRRIRAESEELRKAGQQDQADMLEQAESARYFPERNPNNWPINRSSREMQREYIERAIKETT
jgi:hypothetical protein